jgi:hypothetical protein
MQPPGANDPIATVVANPADHNRRPIAEPRHCNARRLHEAVDRHAKPLSRDPVELLDLPAIQRR